MTTPIVPSISDEQLAELEESFAPFDGQQSMMIKGLIARLRAAEDDAKRWRHARSILAVEAIETAQSDFINFGLPPAESESVRADQAIDAAMERTP